MKCNKPYTVKSDNAKMSGSEKPKSYMGGGMIKSYQMGGMVTPMAKPMSKGPSQRLGPAKAKGKQKMEMERVRGEEMTKKTQDAYKRFYSK